MKAKMVSGGMETTVEPLLGAIWKAGLALRQNTVYFIAFDKILNIILENSFFPGPILHL